MEQKFYSGVSNYMDHACVGHHRSLAERITDTYIIIMLLIFPLFPGFQGYQNITTSKFAFFLAVTGLWGLALIAAVLLQREHLTTHGPAGFAALAYLLVCILSWLCSPHRAAAFLGAGRYDGLLTTAGYVLIFLGVASYSRPKRSYAIAFGISVSLCALVALLQISGRNPLHLFPEGLSFFDAGLSYSGMFLGTIGNTNVLDAVLCLALPMFFSLYLCGRGCGFLLPALLGLFVIQKAGGDGCKLALCVVAVAAMPLLLTDLRRIRRALSALALALAASVLSLSWQPSPDAGFQFSFVPAAGWLLVAAAAVFVAAIIPLPKRFQPGEAALRRSFALLSVLLLLLAIVWVFLSSSSAGTVYELRQVLLGHAEDGFGSSRIRIWRRCLELFRERPLLGGGPGTLALRLKIEFSRFVPETGQTLRSFADNAHNIYLAALTDTGLLGIVGLLAVFGIAAVAGLKQSSSPLFCSFALGAACMMVHEFFGLGLCLSSPLLWLSLGLLCGKEPLIDPESENTQ